VRQIINNLVSNAIKFTVNGGVTIEVDSAEKKGVTYVIIKIIDTGIGVDEKDKDFIFEEFRQVSEGKNRSFEGTGLGLSVTKKFVQNCNGIITVDSETGVGSTFTVLLPAEGDNKADNENEVIETDIDANSTISEQLDIDVLLIEDDSSHVELTKAFLEKFCYVDVALSRKEALERAHNKKYDLLFIDVNLGDELGGIALAQDIRKMDGYQKTPLVAVSAFALKDDDEMTKGTFNFHLLKPFKSKELRNLINTIIGEDVS
jgi:CheY-like chemotaxis protein